MKSKFLCTALLALILIYTACNKISESLQRDVIVKDSVFFDIPILTSITDPYTISDIKIPLNIEEQISHDVQGFSISNLKSVKIMNLNMSLRPIGKDSIDKANNFGNIETVRFGISNGTTLINIGIANNNSNAVSGSLTLTISILPETLKEYLLNPSATYNLAVKARTSTTAPMKVRAMATYIITLSK